MRRPVFFMVFAGIAALAAAMVVYTALKKREAEVQRAVVKVVDIVVAAHPLPVGTKIEPDAVKLAHWSRDVIPPGALTDPSAVIGHYVTKEIVENEPIVAGRLFTGQKTAGVMPLLIPPGMRAMSVPVDEVSDIAGFVQPHARVDVLVALGAGEAGPKPLSKIVLENVEVLAVAQEIEQKKDEPEVVKVVTLLVTPEQAERLALASREGTLRLAMRNYTDHTIVITLGSDVDQMLHAYGEMPLIAPQSGRATAGLRVIRRPQPVAVEIMRDGKTVESLSFVRDGQGGLEADPARPQQPAAQGPSTSAAPGHTRMAGKPAAPAQDAAQGFTSSSPPPGPPTPPGPSPKTIDLP